MQESFGNRSSVTHHTSGKCFAAAAAAGAVAVLEFVTQRSLD